jgi:hypothetical protein
MQMMKDKLMMIYIMINHCMMMMKWVIILKIKEMILMEQIVIITQMVIELQGVFKLCKDEILETQIII